MGNQLNSTSPFGTHMEFRSTLEQNKYLRSTTAQKNILVFSEGLDYPNDFLCRGISISRCFGFQPCPGGNGDVRTSVYFERAEIRGCVTSLIAPSLSSYTKIDFSDVAGIRAIQGTTGSLGRHRPGFQLRCFLDLAFSCRVPKVCTNFALCTKGRAVIYGMLLSLAERL